MSADIKTLPSGKDLLNVAKKVRSKMKKKSATLAAQKRRVEVFTGELLVSELMAKCPKHAPNKETAIKIAKRMLKEQLFLQGTMTSRRVKTPGVDEVKKVNKLAPSMTQSFVTNNKVPFYWNFKVYTFMDYVYAFLVVAGAIFFAMKPIWTDGIRQVVHYSSVCVLCVLGPFLGIYFLGFVIDWIVGFVTNRKKSFAMLPNLTNPDLGLWESFFPIVEWGDRKEDVDSDEEDDDYADVKKRKAKVEDDDGDGDGDENDDAEENGNFAESKGREEGMEGKKEK
eukprot:m.59400 g.59400  ORF g.59400 m.59400 type:complete len:282 (+) comp7908_c0_seq2:70-915(+)